MPQGLSNKGFGDLVGVSEGAVRKGDKAGRIRRFADGSIDPDASRVAWHRGADPARIKARTGPVPVRNAVPVRTEDDAKTAIQLITRVLAAEGVEAGIVDFNAARTADTILKAYQRDLAIAERRKELVPLVKVKEHVEKAFIGVRQAIQRLPSRHVPEMAAALGVDPGALDAALSKAIAAELDVLSAPVVRT